MLSDPEYAEELRRRANEAALGGQHSDAWAKYFGMPELSSLGTDPERLSSLGAAEGVAACTCNSSTITTTTSPWCTGTTTTTTG
jgi:hypothetical protein